MKIDIHVHTKKCKEGDSEQRNNDVSRFNDVIRLTDVRILAITNHNHFDLEQYKSFRDKVEDVCQIWPGSELDVLEDSRRAHLIVIVNPDKEKKSTKRSDKLNISWNLYQSWT